MSETTAPATSPRRTAAAPVAQTPAGTPPVGELVSTLSEQLTRLVRDEMRLAQAEVKQKGKKVGLGVGLFGAAGVLGYFGVAAALVAAGLGLANVVTGWLAALLVAAALFVIAAVAALVGKKDLSDGTPPLPQQAINSVKDDVDSLKSAAGR